MTKTILLVSIALPPRRDPESIQVARYLRFLTASDFKFDIVTSQGPTLYMDDDPDLQGYLQGYRQLVAVRLWENRTVNRILHRLVPALLQFPDSKFSFSLGWKKAVRTLNVKPDLIYSRSYPLSSTVMALKLKKHYQVPWIMHLSDPWAISFEGGSPATNFRLISRKWNTKLETECLGLADYVTLTSRKTIDLYKKAYPQFARKFVYMPNVYDDSTIQANPYHFHGNLKFVYTGGFGHARSPSLFLECIDQFFQIMPEACNKVEFLFTGEVTRSNRLIFEKYQGIPGLRHLGILDYHQVISLQREADILVNIDSDISHEDHTVFLPSKLMEYMAAQRKILCLTNPGSVSDELVKSGLGWSFDFVSKEKIVAHLRTIFHRFSVKDRSYFELNSLLENFSARANADTLLKLMEESTASQS